MTRVTPPLLGYNNNVRYLGRTFHIQTEDSGTKYARIMTHLFIDGGRIVKSTRTEYGAKLDQPDMAENVRRMMKNQHKNMFLSLRAGEFDELIECIVSSGQSTHAVEPTPSQVPRLRTDSPPALAFGADDEPKTIPAGLPTLIIESNSVPAVSRPLATLPMKAPTTDLPENRPLDTTSRPSERPSRVTRVRPSTLDPAVVGPRSQSIFGEVAAGKQTLDEVILSFLDEEET